MRSTVFSLSVMFVAGCVASCLVGCQDDSEKLQRILAKRQVAVQEHSQQDHLGETVALLDQYVELNEQRARQQIAYHINQWMREHAGSSSSPADPASEMPAIAQSLAGFLSPEQLADAVQRPEFTADDVPLLRDANLYRHVVAWIDTPLRDDPIFADWLQGLRAKASESDGATTQDESADTDSLALTVKDIDQLQTAMRLFDWTVRNIALEPDQLAVPAQLPVPAMPPRMPFEGPGFRQTDYQTLWRGRGDWLQRCGVFTQLCLQAGIPTAVLATQSDETGERTPWSVGALIGEHIFLFEPRLGLPIPGPDQTGVATLAEARKDPTLMRRLNVAGYFDYPLSRTDISQNVALLNLRPETLSSRMRTLESGMTGEHRMRFWVDAEDWAKRFDAIPGIAGVRIWEVPTLAELYAHGLEAVADRDPGFAFWYRSRFAVLEPSGTQDSDLVRGRWRHLTGQFVDDESDGTEGARTHYLNQRAPEYEIDDLRINVQLQTQYGLRRELGMDPAEYDARLQQMQTFIRLGKRTATYWLALLQYDDGRYDTAHNWFTKRVLDDEQQSYWADAAVYNAARASEQEGNIAEAITALKTDQNVSDFGNRLRARLLDRLEPGETDSTDDSPSE
ncbi:tetratricopeptide repeat protein [Allorhodopirellula solitaria]|uniref:Uncharacterized protein n=1 Tax=Allorhodopirellula solitaria TaxID=2527987 RepID=A0A5C5YEF4_9BACT|nr:CDC27 family protein [Allorhodopirellula solitaria]TWT73368.1 hypothetical protein CA85_18380 [Allorhodopirellula solitaria]